MKYPHEDFVVCPDHGPRRVVRHVGPNLFPAGDIVSSWDVKTNVLYVRTDLFNWLSPYDKGRILRTRNQYEYIEADRPVFNS